MSKNSSYFNECLDALGLSLSEVQINQFFQYFDYLIEMNQYMNLTAITDFNEVILKHFIDSLSIVKIIDLNSINRMIDIGTGAGFPGIPIKIVFPHINVTLLDSLNKRVTFLNNVTEKLGLNNVISVHGRAEDLARDIRFRETHDLCVSRAVANYSTLLEYCLPFVKMNGCFISYKSGDIEAEIKESRKALDILGGEACDVKKFSLPFSDMGRSLLMTKKVKITPNKYPRKAGLPSKSPIK